jgi:hypothetical protein
MTTLVTKCKLLCQDTDSQGYITYVFELLESEEMNRLGNKYVMCVRWPNWDHRELRNGEVGFLSYSIIEAGVDCWYDTSSAQLIPYNYTSIQFNKFIAEQPEMTHSFKL